MINLVHGDVKLREFRMEDCHRLVHLANNENISRNLRDGFPHPYTINHAEEFIRNAMMPDPATLFAIEYKEEYVGNIGMVKCKDVYRKSAEVGYFLGEQYWGKGIMTRALGLICEYGFQNLDIVRIHTGVYEHNLASQRVLEKCGFVKEGVFRMAVYKYDRYWNEVRYALIKE
ncbi:MAG TPA: GNAT family protein [Bacteroidales bacterium]|nr:GNAT family protein [Bacteroidales bacterium]HOX78490.1 GNAT family protein [Bacteroidales bacterium]HPI85660.1 GNAT family protein [Bacteroidales bacterium]HPM91336.1 GNAT family protein [Bacteroidales bacterium]